MDEMKVNYSSPTRQSDSKVSSPKPTPARKNASNGAAEANALAKQARENRAALTKHVQKSQEAAREGRVAEQAAVVSGSEQQVEAAVKSLNDYVQSVQRNLHFQYDKDSGRSIIKVVDRVTQEVIRQIPEESALKLARKLNEQHSVTLLNVKV